MLIKKLKHICCGTFAGIIVLSTFLMPVSALADPGGGTEAQNLIYGVINDQDPNSTFSAVSFPRPCLDTGGSDQGGGGGTQHYDDVPSCEGLASKWYRQLQANPGQLVITDQTTFLSFYDAGRKLQQQIENNWWNGDNVHPGDALIKYYIELNHELFTHKKDPTTKYSQFKDIGGGNITFDTPGSDKWTKLLKDRSAINLAASELYRILIILNTPKPANLGGGMWRTDTNFLGASTDPEQQDVDSYSVYHPSNIKQVITDGSGFDALTIDATKTYTSLATFTQDYSNFYALQAPQIASNVDDKGKAISGGSTVSADVAIIAFGGIADSVESTKNDTLKTFNKQRCGGGSSSLFSIFTSDTLFYTGCVITDAIGQFADSLLLSAAQLLFVTAGIPGASSSPTLTSGTHFDSTQTAKSFWGDSGPTFIPQGISTPVQYIVTDTNSQIGSTIRSTYDVVVKLLYVIIVFLFLAVALANILQIQTNVYGIRKLVPGMLVGIIAAQASFFILRATLEVVGEAANGIVTLAGKNGAYHSDSVIQNFVDAFSSVRGPAATQCLTDPVPATSDDCASGKVDNGRVFQQFVLNGFVIAGAVALFILGFLFGARIFIFAIALPLAPLAVFTRFVPPLSAPIWGRWWKTVSGWIFMPVVAVLPLVISSIYFSAVNVHPDNPALKSSDLFNYLLNYVAGIFFLFTAIQAPFKMAGEGKQVLDRYNALGKGLWNKTGGAAGKEAKQYVTDSFQARIGTSRIGELQRTMARKKEDRKEDVDSRKKGIMTDVQRLKNDKELEGINAQIDLHDSRVRDLGVLTEEKTDIAMKKAQLQIDRTNPSLSSTQLADIDNEIATLTTRAAAITTKQGSINAEITGETFNVAELRNKKAQLDKPTAAGRVNQRTFQAQANHQKESEMRKKSVDQDKTEAERLLATAHGQNSFKEADELMRISAGTTARAVEDTRRALRKNFIEAESVSTGDLQNIVKSQRVQSTFSSKVQGRINDTEDKKDDRAAVHEIVFTQRIAGISDPEDSKKAIQEAQNVVRDDIREFVAKRGGIPKLKGQDATDYYSRVIDPVNNPPAGTADDLEKRRDAAIDLLMIEGKLNTDRSTTVDSLKSAATTLRGLTGNLESQRILDAFNQLTGTEPNLPQLISGLVNEYKQCELHGKIGSIYVKPAIVIARDGVGL